MADLIEGLDYTGRQTYLAWTTDVAKRGGLAVELPAQSGQAGVLGERYPAAVIAARQMGEPLVWTTGKVYGYYLAPLNVRVLDKLHQVNNNATIVAGNAAAVAENVAKTITGFSSLIVLGAGIIGAVILVSMMHGGGES